MKYEKLSASMAALVEELASPSASSMMSGPRAVPLASANPALPPAVFAYVRCNEGANLEQVPGAHMHAQRGSVRTALLTLEGVDRLSEHQSVSRIAPSVALNPLNDFAARRTGLPSFKNHTGASGRNVIVGIVDSGIDVNHPAFAGRILGIWDQTIPGVGWGTTNYGAVLTGGFMPISVDTNGHGTHVAGTAAGNDAEFGGVAPNAWLVIVKTNFLNTGIGDGIRFVFAVADALNLPAVVNLSLGGHHDAHDGSDDLSEFINGRTGPGRIVVAAAGNEGGHNIHGAAAIPPQQTVEMLFNVPPNSQPGAAPFVRLNGWYEGTGNCEISILTSSGDATPFQPVLADGGQTSVTYNFLNAIVSLTTPPPTATPNGDHQFLVEIKPSVFASAVQGGTWQLRIRNAGATAARIDVWAVVPSGTREVGFIEPFNSPDMKIGSPGCADQVITVAAYTTRNTWLDIFGAARSVGMQLETISDFSSPGPLRNNARKPDVAAPGAMIISCLSGQTSFPPMRVTDVVNTGFRVDAGTSMACPFITGLVALLLEFLPALDPQTIKTFLQAHSAIPGQPPGAFDQKWGFGLIDIGNL
jgi:subtilisin family serine protease